MFLHCWELVFLRDFLAIPAIAHAQALARVLSFDPRDAHLAMLFDENSITSSAPTLANSIGINGRAAAACRRSNKGTLLSTRDAANKCARTGATRGSQLVAMLLPEASAMFMAITNACVMRMRVVAVPMPQPTASSG